MDSNLNIKWKIIYSESTIEDLYTVHQFPDSSYVSVGFHADPFYGSAFGFIAKTDKNGKQIWQHDYYKRQDYDNYMADVQQTSDKDYIITGTAWDSMPNPSQDIWLIRLDSNGCLIPGCDTAVTGVIEVTNTKSEFSIFPNPANNKITILYNVPTFLQDAILEIHDREGRLLYTEHLDTHAHELSLATNQWPQGLYACSMYSTNQLLKGKTFMIMR